MTVYVRQPDLCWQCGGTGSCPTAPAMCGVCRGDGEADIGNVCFWVHTVSMGLWERILWNYDIHHPIRAWAFEHLRGARLTESWSWTGLRSR